MYRTFNGKFGREMTIIHPGEYCSSGDEVILSTILGSCVSVVIFDPVTRIGGLNHFMLAESRQGKVAPDDTAGRYGINAMELLINDLMKHGARKDSFQAKVFGGGHVINTAGTSAIPESNINFAINFLKEEGIPVAARDTGGNHGRKIFLFPDTGQVLLKRFTGSLAAKAAQEELDYLRQLRERQRAVQGDITLF